MCMSMQGDLSGKALPFLRDYLVLNILSFMKLKCYLEQRAGLLFKLFLFGKIKSWELCIVLSHVLKNLKFQLSLA